jgi:hypothetical protein
MHDKANKKKKRVRNIYWVCDKKDCATCNNRVIPADIVLNDDVCDYCHCRIHEPILIELTNDKH